MIAKIPKPGKSFGGCIEYNLLKKDAAILYADGVRTGDVRHTIADFNMQRKMNPALGQAVGHIALSWSPNDRDKLNDELMTAIARDYLQRMKIDNTQVLIAKHEDRSHPHLHIIYNRVNNAGKTISDSLQRQKSIKICKALTLQHGFHIARDKQQVNRLRLKGIDKIRYDLYDAIKAVSRQVYTLGQLKSELAKKGIEMQYKYKIGTPEIQGISFAKGQYKFKGSEIDRSLSYGRLSKQINEQAPVKEQQRIPAAKEPSLADQLREVIAGQESGQTTATHHRHTEVNVMSEVFGLSGQLLSAGSSGGEPEDPRRRRKKKGHVDEQQQGIGR
jgi:hypothetical protein